MPKFTSIPVVIDAIQVTETNLDEIADFVVGKVSKTYVPGPNKSIVQGVFVHALDADFSARYGDWIVRGVTGILHSCRIEAFEHMYRPYQAGHLFPEDN